MTEETLFESIDRIKSEINERLLGGDFSAFWDICHMDGHELFEAEDEELLWMRIISDAVATENSIQKEDVLDAAKNLGKCTLFDGLVSLFQKTLLDLKRIDNSLDEDTIIDGLEELLLSGVPVDMIIQVSEYGMSEPRRVINIVASAYKAVKPLEAVRLYRYVLE